MKDKKESKAVLPQMYIVLLRDMEKELKSLIYSTCAPHSREIFLKLANYMVEIPPNNPEHLDVIIEALAEMRSRLEEYKNEDCRLTCEELGYILTQLEEKKETTKK